MVRFPVRLITFLVLFVQTALSYDGERWYPAVVDSMAGRFGAFMEGYRYRKLGYLTLISDGADVYSITMGDNLFLGRPYLASSYEYEEKYSWTGAERTWKFDGATGQKDFIKVYESLLAPGFLYETSEPLFRWCWEEQKTGQGFILPLERGVVRFGEGERYLADIQGRMAENWILVTFSGSRDCQFDCPLLFIFENKPVSLEVVTHEFLDIRFPQAAGKIVVMPLYGVKKVENEKTRSFTSGVPREVVQSCSAWASRMCHYPVAAHEVYRFGIAGELIVKDSYDFISFEGAEGEPLAPLPPFLRLAQLTGYPVQIGGQLVETGYPTHYGALDYVKGPELSYTVPACSYMERTLAPVRLEGIKDGFAIEEAIVDRLVHPRWIWPGDHDYQPDDVMDTLHNLRLLTWTAWSLPEKIRGLYLKGLARPGLDKIKESHYFFFEDPVAKAVYARDSTIFAQRGKTSYDSDWYNGFQLAGLWAYSYFGDKKDGLAVARNHWNIWTALRNYMEIYHDWATCCSTTDPRGNLIDYDCMRNGWQGLLGYGRLARDLGKIDLYRQTRFLASKTMIAHYVQWTLPEYFYDLASSFPPDSAKWLKVYKKEEITGVSTLNAYSLHGFILPDNEAPYNLSACIPEHSLFLNDFGLTNRLRKLTYELMPRYHPDWSKFDPNTYTSPGGWWSANAVAGRYFYFLDPHLFVRAINFNEPLEILLSYRKLEWLSGQIIEAMLVGSRPMLIVPTYVEFQGNVWNEKDRSLTFALDGKGWANVEIRNCVRPRKVSPDAVLNYNIQKRTAYLRIELAGLKKTSVYF